VELEDRVQKLETEMVSLKRMFLDDVKNRSLRLPL